ncbi:UDP-N-acetylmuramoyl-L-alanine--D-glutamate ligase [Arenicella xantha]|uniref:UDP-N-acetylmuramoylalanine--D-glutamate ligase n=1 Tax=Arenicella xantha TaxID=644221 RepID=A0A395JP70_9GAMM|nr:UDP-N-acetylmuramoyl-L-alanine--D-glutamate ligase [Arenicella xantha]RBP49864.1 UDP-N-acetylmuramoylalanine--D-glutamate ligase [Arenicella xantha]
MTSPRRNLTTKLIEQYQRAAVVGLGISGLSVVRYLRSHSIEVIALDSRSVPPAAQALQAVCPEVKTVFGAFDAEHLDGAELIVVSPGVSIKEPMLVQARRRGAKIVGDIELFLQVNQKPLIAITGSNGKSTVTALVGEMVCAGGMVPLVAGNIGKPVLDALTDNEPYDVAVLELSSFQLETTNQVPADAAAILNISPDHLDRYDSMGDYVLAKSRILRGAQRAVLPRHDDQFTMITQTGDVLSFELDEPHQANEFGVKKRSSGRWLMHGKTPLMRLSDIGLLGLHNVKNVVSAFALTDFLGLTLESQVAAVKAFTGLPHRMQTVASDGGVIWVNDSKATNVGATITALRNLESPVVWIAGGQGKGADFADLADAITDDVRVLILLGEDADKIDQALRSKVKIERVKDMEAAVVKAAEYARPDDVVLLSPACASFDMFTGFEHRGAVFIACVERLLQRGAA